MIAHIGLALIAVGLFGWAIGNNDTVAHPAVAVTAIAILILLVAGHEKPEWWRK